MEETEGEIEEVIGTETGREKEGVIAVVVAMETEEITMITTGHRETVRTEDSITITIITIVRKVTTNYHLCIPSILIFVTDSHQTRISSDHVPLPLPVTQLHTFNTTQLCDPFYDYHHD